MGVPMWLLSTVGGCERVFQGLDAAGYYIAGRQAACVSGSGELVRGADCLPSQSRWSPLPHASTPSDAATCPVRPVYGRCLRCSEPKSSELRGPPQSYHEDKRDGFEEYGPSAKYLPQGFNFRSLKLEIFTAVHR